MSVQNVLRLLPAVWIMLCLADSALAKTTDQDWSQWADRFVAFVSSPASLSLDSRKLPQSLATLAPMKSDQANGCTRTFSLAADGPPFIVSAQAVVLGVQSSGCEGGQLGLLLIGLTGAAPEVANMLQMRLTTALHRQPEMLQSGDNTDLHWQLTSQAAVEVGTSRTEPGQVQLRLANAPKALSSTTFRK